MHCKFLQKIIVFKNINFKYNRGRVFCTEGWRLRHLIIKDIKMSGKHAAVS